MNYILYIYKMKKLILLSLFVLASCSKPDTEQKECDCDAIVYVNNVPNGQTFEFSDDCKDDGLILETYTEAGYFAQTIVECD